LFLFDFSLIYNEFKHEIEKELFKNVINRALNYLEVVNTALEHSYPDTALCRVCTSLSKEKLEWKLLECEPFIPEDMELWEKYSKQTEENYKINVRITYIVNEPVLEKGTVDKIMLALKKRFNKFQCSIIEFLNCAVPQASFSF
jgi:hypothetical protein